VPPTPGRASLLACPPGIVLATSVLCSSACPAKVTNLLLCCNSSGLQARGRRFRASSGFSCFPPFLQAPGEKRTYGSPRDKKDKRDKDERVNGVNRQGPCGQTRPAGNALGTRGLVNAPRKEHFRGVQQWDYSGIPAVGRTAGASRVGRPRAHASRREGEWLHATEDPLRLAVPRGRVGATGAYAPACLCQAAFTKGHFHDWVNAL